LSGRGGGDERRTAPARLPARPHQQHHAPHPSSQPPETHTPLFFQSGDRRAGARAARDELPFLFRAFEAGQVPPPRPGTKKAAEARAATIHEYLDWTLTAEASPADAGGGAAFADADDLDFGGFRAVILVPRFRPGWPPPGAYDAEGPAPSVPGLGGPCRPLPLLMPAGKPICAAVIRSAPGFLEVPFFATAEARRNRGYGRALLECIEAIARALGLPRLLLCATDDPITRGTWLSLGFAFTTDDDLKEWGVLPGDLLHMDNTVQMHRAVPPLPALRAVKVRHGALVQRVYARVGGGGAGGGEGGAGGGGGGGGQQQVQQQQQQQANGGAAPPPVAGPAPMAVDGGGGGG
jgi:GNAT superfamily N-acetyltransferase